MLTERAAAPICYPDHRRIGVIRHSHRIGVLARANMLDWGKHSLPERHVPTSGEEFRLAQIRR